MVCNEQKTRGENIYLNRSLKMRKPLPPSWEWRRWRRRRPGTFSQLNRQPKCYINAYRQWDTHKHTRMHTFTRTQHGKAQPTSKCSVSLLVYMHTYWECGWLKDETCSFVSENSLMTQDMVRICTGFIFLLVEGINKDIHSGVFYSTVVQNYRNTLITP